MVIGYILDDTLDRPDGVQQATIAIGEHMRKLGHDVHYIVPQTTRTDLQNIHSIGKYVRLPFNGNSVRTPRPLSKKVIKELYADISFDVLHVQMPYSPLFAGRLIQHAPKNCKVVGTFHILPYSVLSNIGTHVLGLLLHRSLKRYAKFYAVSKPALDFMQRALKVRGDVLPNPVRYAFFNAFTEGKRKHMGTHIVFVGRFEERKGVIELIRAYAALEHNIRNATSLTMIGAGPLHDQAQELARDIAVDITFPGFVSEEEKAQYLNDADIAVFPSKSGESFGIVLAEAMAAGSGVTLGGNNPGYASVLTDWPDTLFDPKDTSSFAATLTRFIEDVELRSQIGSAQHASVKAYDIEHVVERLLKEAYSINNRR